MHGLVDAIDLLARGQGQRLLISGVNPMTTEREIARLRPEHERIIACCVDLDRTAVNTITNATETRRWVMDRGFKSLIVVTSSYHMPRSLIELGRAIPNVTLVAYPIQSRNFHPDTWWRHLPSARILLSEYIKLLRSVTHYGLSRLWPWGRSIPLAHGERAAGK